MAAAFSSCVKSTIYAAHRHIRCSGLTGLSANCLFLSANSQGIFLCVCRCDKLVCRVAFEQVFYLHNLAAHHL